MIVVFQFFRAGLAIASHPGEALQALRDAGDSTAQRRAEMNEIVQFALKTLRDNSPVGSGKDPHPGLYRDSHMVFVNGGNVSDLSSWNPGDEIEISNPVAYARILELGDGKTRVPHNIYDLSEQTLQAKYGDIAKIELTFLGILGGEVVNQAAAHSFGGWFFGSFHEERAASGVRESRLAKKFGKAAHNRSNARFPVIVIKGLS